MRHYVAQILLYAGIAQMKTAKIATGPATFHQSCEWNFWDEHLQFFEMAKLAYTVEAAVYIVRKLAVRKNVFQEMNSELKGI